MPATLTPGLDSLRNWMNRAFRRSSPCSGTYISSAVPVCRERMAETNRSIPARISTEAPARKASGLTTGGGAAAESALGTTGGGAGGGAGGGGGGGTTTTTGGGWTTTVSRGAAGGG